MSRAIGLVVALTAIAAVSAQFAPALKAAAAAAAAMRTPQARVQLSNLKRYDIVHLTASDDATAALHESAFAVAADAPYPATLAFAFDVPAAADAAAAARRYRVEMHQNQALVPRSYTEERHSYDETGKRVSTEIVRNGAMPAAQNCYYRGSVSRVDAGAAEESNLYVAADLCTRRGVSAYVSRRCLRLSLHLTNGCVTANISSLYLGGEWYSLEPASDLLSRTETNAYLNRVRSARQPFGAMPTVAAAAGDRLSASPLHILYRNDAQKKLRSVCGAHSHPSASPTSTAAAFNPAEVSHVTESIHPSPFDTYLDDGTEAELESTVASAAAAAAQSGGEFELSAIGNGTASRYVELLIVNDYARYVQNADSTESSALAIVNRAAVLYSQNVGLSPPIEVVLIGQLTWRTADPYNTCVGQCDGACPACGDEEVGVTALLNSFNAWRVNPANTPYHDSGFLLSGFNFEGALIGFAAIGSMCNYATSGGVVQTYQNTNSVAGFALTHELGHNLGMVHDSLTSCSPVGYVMTTTISPSNPPVYFSNCALNAYRYYYGNLSRNADGTAAVTCLDNRPVYAWNSAPVCGNGFVEGTETCDCGGGNCAAPPDSDLTDPCCNGATCQLITANTCSARNPCCSATCQPVGAAAATTCRTADRRSGCDASQTCGGLANGTCPNKSFQPSGTACINTQIGFNGFCDALDHCNNLSAAHAARSPAYATAIALAGLVTAALLRRF